jgi:siroheme synthase-like protein
VPDYFPAFLDLRGRRCLVVGGGDVAARKVRALVECGARVAVVSPTVTPALAALATAGLARRHPRRFRRWDARGCALVVAASGHAAVDEAVARAGRRARALVNVVDRADACDFIVPSVLRRGALQIAVSTGGRSPALAREIRRRLEPLFGAEYAALVERVATERARARAAGRGAAERLDAGERVVAAALREGVAAPAGGGAVPA